MVVAARRGALLVIAAGLVGACGAASHERDAGAGAKLDAAADAAGPDAGPQRDAAVDAACPELDAQPMALADAGPWSEPEAFPREGCEPGTLADLDPTGEWQIFFGNEDYRADDPRYLGELWPLLEVVRFTGGCWSYEVEPTVYWGGEPVPVRLDASDMLFRFAPEWFGKVTFDACTKAADGRLWGRWGWCTEGDCHGQGTFLAQRLEPIAGEPEARGLELLGEWNGPVQVDSTRNCTVRVRDGIAYVARWSDGLRILDVRDPARIRELGHVPTEIGRPHLDVDVVDGPAGERFVYAGSIREMAVIDVTDPGTAREIATFTQPPPHEDRESFPGDFVTAPVGGAMYGFWSELQYEQAITVWRLEDPAAPELVAEYGTSCAVQRLAADSTSVYGSCPYDSNPGLIVISLPLDASDLGIEENAAMAGHGPASRGAASGTTREGDPILISIDPEWDAHVRVLDLRDRFPFLEELGSVTLRPQVIPADVQVLGDRAYLAYCQDGVRVVDLSDPRAPAFVAHFQTWDWTVGEVAACEGARRIEVDPTSELLYVSDLNRGLLVLRETL